MNNSSFQEQVLISKTLLNDLPVATEEKVAILVTSEFEGIFKNGGIGTYYRTLSHKLTEEGWKIILVLFKEPDAFNGKSTLSHIKTIVSANCIDRLILLTDFHQLILSQFTHWDWVKRESYLILFFIQALCNYFNNQTHLYIEFPDFWGIGYPTIEAKESGLLTNNAVVATTIHGPHDWIYEVNDRFTVDNINSWKWFFDVSQRERTSFEKSDIPIYLSNFLKNRVKGYGWDIEKAVHLPYCFPVINQEYTDNHNTQVEAIARRIGDRIPIIFFGRMEERKGFLTFVDAVKSLDKKLYEQIYIIFLGRVVSLSQHQIKNHNSETYLQEHFSGLVTYEIFSDLFSQEAINIVRNLNNPIVCLTSLEENFPNTGLEIGQLNVSLIASDTGGFRETIGLVQRGESLRWFKSGNYYSLKCALENAINSYPEQPLVASPESLVRVNANLLNLRLSTMEAAFTNLKNQQKSNFSLTVHCHLPNNCENISLFLDSLKPFYSLNSSVILTYVFDNNYYEYLSRVYPQITFIAVEPGKSLGDILNQVVVNFCKTKYFLNLPSPDCLPSENLLDRVEGVVTRANADVITLPLVFGGGADTKIESPPISLLEIITSEALTEVLAVFSVTCIQEVGYPQELKVQGHNLHLLGCAMATGKNIVNYPYPMLTSSQSLKIEVEPLVFLQQLNYIYKTLSGFDTSLWQSRQLYRLLSGCEKLSHLSVHRKHVEASSQQKDRKSHFLTSAIATYHKALAVDPTNTNIQQKLGRLVLRHGNYDRSFELYGLERVDRQEINLDRDEVLCFLVVRNELLRLPYLLEFYRNKGIKKFFIAENNSEDGTREFLAEQKDVYLWTTNRSYKEAHMGIDWNEILLKRYGQGHWCLNIDADEILYYPGFESFNIPELCTRLESQNKHALPVVLLDMYSDKPIRKSLYKSGEDFLNVCPYFDKQFYHYKEDNSGPCKNMTYFRGGLRQRVFNTEQKDIVFTVNKVPLFKYDRSVIIYAGHHWTNIPQQHIASARGALLHFKYLHSFVDYVTREVSRDEHVGGAFEYRKYQTKLEEEKDLVLFNPNESVKLESSQTLLECGVMDIGELIDANVALV